jgi:hypothetical protein
LFVHIKLQQHGVYLSFDDGLFLKFSTFTTKAIVGRDDIYLDAVPHSDNHVTSNFDHSSQTSNVLVSSCCHHVTQQDEITGEPVQDNILQSLCQYYAEVKT